MHSPPLTRVIPSLRNWRPQQLLGAWATYWAGLVGVTLGPALFRVWQVTRDDSVKSSASAGFGDGMLHAEVLTGATTLWSGTASLTTVVLLVAVPPLVLWAVWLFVRPARTEPSEPLLLDEPRDFNAFHDARDKQRSPSSHDSHE